MFADVICKGNRNENRKQIKSNGVTPEYNSRSLSKTNTNWLSGNVY